MRRLLPLLVLLGLTVAACADDDTAVFPATSTTDQAVGTTGAATETSDAQSTTSAPTTTTATTAAPASSTTTTGPTTTAAPVPVTTHPGLPTALSRSLIPMSQIDESWVAVAYSADAIAPPEDGPTVIYLVSPQGDRYEVAAFEPDAVEPYHVGNIANGGTHVAVLGTDPSTLEGVVMSVDIASGARSVIRSVEGGASISTTLPTGRDVVVLHTTFSPTESNLEVYRTNGSLFADITSIPDQGPGLTWLYGLDGTYLLVGTPSGLHVYSNDGTLVRSLDTPAGYCEPVRWWDDSTILAACVPQAVLNAGGYYNVLWRIPIDGSPGTQLTADPPPGWDFVEFGHADAWRTSAGTMLQWWGDCAARGIQSLQPDGTGAWIALDPSGAPWIHAQAGDDLIVHTIEGCGDPYGPVYLLGTDGSLVQTLVPQLAGYQGVVSVAGMIPVP